jgi:hypothetical protein
VLYHVGNCVNLCQFGESFLLVVGINPHSLYEKRDISIEDLTQLFGMGNG